MHEYPHFHFKRHITRNLNISIVYKITVQMFRFKLLKDDSFFLFKSIHYVLAYDGEICWMALTSNIYNRFYISNL